MLDKALWDWVSSYSQYNTHAHAHTYTVRAIEQIWSKTLADKKY